MAQVEKETAPPTAAAGQGANANTRLVAVGPSSSSCETPTPTTSLATTSGGRQRTCTTNGDFADSCMCTSEDRRVVRLFAYADIVISAAEEEITRSSLSADPSWRLRE